MIDYALIIGESDIHTRMKLLRQKKDLSMSKLVEELGIDITPGTISNIENGKTLPSVTLVAAYSEYFDVTTDYIIKGEMQVPKFSNPNEKMTVREVGTNIPTSMFVVEAKTSLYGTSNSNNSPEFDKDIHLRLETQNQSKNESEPLKTSEIEKIRELIELLDTSRVRKVFETLGTWMLSESDKINDESPSKKEK